MPNIYADLTKALLLSDKYIAIYLWSGGNVFVPVCGWIRWIACCMLMVDQM